MAIRNIVLEGDDVLRKRCRTVAAFDKKLALLLDDMKETLKKADGCGLAAPQVGILRRIVIIDVGDGPIELINPEIIRVSRKQQREVEGCLSLPDKWGYVRRPFKVTIKAQNRKGEFFVMEGAELFARCVCHELDHLEGKLFTDIADEMVDPSEVENKK